MPVELHLRAEKKSPKTIRIYLEAAQWFAAETLTLAQAGSPYEEFGSLRRLGAIAVWEKSEEP